MAGWLGGWHVAFMVHWDGTSVVVTAFCSTHEAFGLVRFHGAFRVPGTLGRGALVAGSAKVEAPGHPRHPPSTKRRGC